MSAKGRGKELPSDLSSLSEDSLSDVDDRLPLPPPKRKHKHHKRERSETPQPKKSRHRETNGNGVASPVKTIRKRKQKVARPETAWLQACREAKIMLKGQKMASIPAKGSAEHTALLKRTAEIKEERKRAAAATPA